MSDLPIAEELARAFEEFKAAVEQEIKEVKRGVDPLTAEKVNKLNDALDELQKKNEEVGKTAEHRLEDLQKKLDARLDEIEAKAQRTQAAAGVPETKEASEHKAAFQRWLRKGVGEDQLRDLERKALQVSVDEQGGFAVPQPVVAEIDKLAVDLSPMRQIARVITVGAGGYKRLVNAGGTVSGWVGEAEARAETATPTFKQVEPPIGELYANPAVSQAMLDDAFFDVESWLAAEVAEQFAVAESAAFLTGSGTNQPRGFLTYPTVDEGSASWSWGNIGFVKSGANGGFASSNPADKLFDLEAQLKSRYRTNASWLAPRAVIQAIRKLKDANGQYLWQPGLQAGQPASLIGYPVREDEHMPPPAANSLSLAFGDFRAGYVIVDRADVRVLRDPFTNKPFVHFYTTKRVGGAVINFEALKLMKFAA